MRNAKDLRRSLYGILPPASLSCYAARRRGLDHKATHNGRHPVAEVQKSFLLRWVGTGRGNFLELDAGDGVTGSHAVWLEEAGWKGFSFEGRPAAAERLQKNRPASYRSFSTLESISWEGVDLVVARRKSLLDRVVKQMNQGFRPRRVIFQVRDPRPDLFQNMLGMGYRLDHFIHDDEYYRLQGT